MQALISRHSLAQREQGLRESVAELRALGEVTQAVNSSVDLEPYSPHRRQSHAALRHGSRCMYVFDDAKQEFSYAPLTARRIHRH